MKIRIRLLCMLLTALLFTSAFPIFAAQDITLTAVNDSFLPLSSSTMPVRRNGDLYVPYSVFQNIGLNASYTEKQQFLVMYNWDYTLNFSISQGYVYDQNDKSYSPPAYLINNTAYVPVKLICNVFGLSYSTISASYPVLRITNDNVFLSDHAFVTNNADTISRMVSAFLNPSTPEVPTTPTTPNTTEPVSPVQPPTAEQEVPQPSAVYLTFIGAPSSYTGDILDTLAQFGRTGTFFLSAQDFSNGDMIRRIVAEGHNIGFSITANAANADITNTVNQLTQANAHLFALCGVQTRLVFVENGVAALSQAQRDWLITAGYRMWNSTLDARDTTRSAYRSAEFVLTAFQKTSQPIVLQLHHSANSAGALSYILRYMRDTAITEATVEYSTTPINSASDTR